MTFDGLILDEERALYGLRGATVRACCFAGPADGESALKECGDLAVEDCHFDLRYPLWHVDNSVIRHCEMTENCRAALWYDSRMRIVDSRLNGIKALRECDDTELLRCQAQSPEFGWFCRGVRVADCDITSEYLFLHSRDLHIDRLRMRGKYSFQYARDVDIRNSVLDTKDAFWHCHNVTVTDSEVKGEYLGWYSQDLRLIRCHITGTQPLCYAKGLVMEDCTMDDTDLSFENADVRATVRGHIISVKNPLSGCIEADSIGQIILDENLPKSASCVILSPSGG